MKSIMKGFKIGLGFCLGFGVSALMAVAISGTIKTWSTGETLLADDLNTTIGSIVTTIEGIPDMQGLGIAGYLSDGTPYYKRLVAIDCATMVLNADGYRSMSHGVAGNIVSNGRVLSAHFTKTMQLDNVTYTSLPSSVHSGFHFDGLWPLYGDGAAVGDVNIYVADFLCNMVSGSPWVNGTLVIEYY